MRCHLDDARDGIVSVDHFRHFLTVCGPFAQCAIKCVKTKPVEYIRKEVPVEREDTEDYDGDSHGRDMTRNEVGEEEDAAVTGAIDVAMDQSDAETVAKDNERNALELLHKSLIEGYAAQEHLQHKGLLTAAYTLRAILGDASTVEENLIKTYEHGEPLSEDAMHQLCESVYRLICRSELLAMITPEVHALDDMAEGMIAAREAKQARRLASIATAQSCKADLMLAVPTLVADLFIQDMTHNLELSNRGMLADDTQLASKAAVLKYQASLIDQLKDSVASDNTKQEIDALQEHYEAIASEKECVEQNEDPVDLTSRRLMRLHSLKRENTALRNESNRQNKDIEELRHKVAAGRKRLSMEKAKMGKCLRK